MIQSCHERKDPDGVRLFQYILRVIAKLKPTGMSEDEDGVDPVVNSAGVTIDEPVKFTMILPFRNVYFNDVVDFVDHLPGFERLLFIQSGRVKKRRVRGDPRCKTSKRKAPMRWPRSFFSPEYLNGMSELQRMKHVGKNDVDLWEIDFTTHKDRFKKS
ncbi:hypothetical protein F5878DRAFT_532687 [Lentinula raphanica]|uniref:Uncharacterized protein n=1 Tax=Lentinula raphanica TaxID=153919 RepID=A0AA38PDH7_9AGAR|nr:hypothetical protein F5878DRAFT_532687 [Lentinula raphanica]